MMLQSPVTSCYTLGMNENDIDPIEDDEQTWLTIIREGVAHQAELTFQRDWDIIGARREGFTVTEIAKAASLSRMQTTRILDRMGRLLKIIMERYEVEEYEVVDAVAEDMSWGNFRFKIHPDWIALSFEEDDK